MNPIAKLGDNVTSHSLRPGNPGSRKGRATTATALYELGHPKERVSGLPGTCWPKEGSFYANVPKRADVLEMMREGTPIRYSWDTL
jgi:hypothetical protein